MNRRHFATVGAGAATAALLRPAIAQTVPPPSPENLRQALPSASAGPHACDELPQLPAPPSETTSQELFPGSSLSI